VKVLLISSFALPSPPKTYGGLERVAYEEALGLAELGHDVTLVASKGSKAPSGVNLIETVPSFDTLSNEEKQRLGKEDRLWNNWRRHEELAFDLYKDKIAENDVVMDLSWSKWSYSTRKDEILGILHSIQQFQSNPPREFPLLCGVSKGHARFLTAKMHKAHRVVWNPVNVDEFTVREKKEDRILSLNRIMPTKGIHLFLDVVEKCRVKADVVGDDSMLVPDQNYVSMIKERCKKSAFAVYWGLVDDATRARKLQEAKATVCMKDGGYEEIFGLMAVESLACGTPVVALDSWGFQDILTKETGVLCKSVDEVASAVNKIMSGELVFKAEDCRKQAEFFKRANICRMLEQTLKAVASGSRW